jgi:hypothetical protein
MTASPHSPDLPFVRDEVIVYSAPWLSCTLKCIVWRVCISSLWLVKSILNRPSLNTVILCTARWHDDSFSDSDPRLLIHPITLLSCLLSNSPNCFSRSSLTPRWIIQHPKRYIFPTDISSLLSEIIVDELLIEECALAAGIMCHGIILGMSSLVLLLFLRVCCLGEESNTTVPKILSWALFCLC